MSSDIINLVLMHFSNFLNVIVVFIVTIILGKRIRKDKKEKGYYNVIRFLILGVFIGLSWVIFWEFISESTPFSTIIAPEIVGIKSNHFTLYTIGLGFMVTCGLAMMFYANEWEIFYLSPAIFYGAMFFFYFFTGNDDLLLPYIYSGGIVSIIFLYLTGIRIRDNGSFGLAIIFTLAFPTLIFPDFIITNLLGIGFSLFSIIFVLGHFKPFKPVEVRENE